MDLFELDDHVLIERTAEGNVLAFETLYARHRARVFGTAMRITGRPRTAEEVTQDVFLTIWRTARRYEATRGTLTAWLLAATRNRSIDCLRRDARPASDVELDDALASRTPAPDDVAAEAADREAAREMRRLLTELPAAQRQVIELSYFQQLTQREIATALGVPLGTVKGRQRLAYHRLRIALEPATAAI